MKTNLIFILNSNVFGRFFPHFLFAISFLPFQINAQFTPNRLVVLQAGDGILPLSSNGNSILFKEYSTSGMPGYSMAVPSTGSNALIIRGSANSEGHISLSEDGSAIVFGAYAQSLPFGSPLNSPAASTLNRGIGLVFANGNYSLGAIGASPFANGDIRGATATTTSNLWASSSSAGTSYYGSASTQGNVQNSKSNLRAIHIFNQQLYISSHSAAGTPSVIGIYAVGTGTPVSSSQMVSLVFATGNNSQPCQFYFNAANTLCYIADSRNNASGGIQKWVKSAGTWSLAYTLSTGSTAAGAQGLVADFSGNHPKVYATTSESVNNRLVAINDLGPASTVTVLATATTLNTIFRGLCFSPGTIPCNPPVVLGITSNSVLCSQDTLVLYPNVNGNSPLSYTWSGAGNFNSVSVASPSIVNTSSGNYSLFVANVCGTSSAVVSISVNPSPTLQLNEHIICSGGVATLIATGANTYTWNTGSNANSFTVNPTVSTNYTVSGSSSQGCLSSPTTTTVNLITSLILAVNSATICEGSSVTLNVSGANSYTWAFISTGSIVVVSPAVSTIYTVTGSAPGCPSNASATVTVSVLALPDVNFISPFDIVCDTEPDFSLQGSPAGGVFSGTGINGDQFSPSQAGIGTNSISYSYTANTGCSNFAVKTLTVASCLDLHTKYTSIDFQIFPNPVKEELQVSFKTRAEKYSIGIYNTHGQNIKVFETKEPILSLPVHELQSGVYFLEISSGTYTQSLKFIKE